MADVRIHQMMTSRRLHDPLGIQGLTFWNPLDERRDMVPTWQKVQAVGDVPQVFEIYKGVPCLNQTGDANAKQRTWIDSPKTILTPSMYMSAGNGFTLSVWYYGNEPAGSNLVQIMRQPTASRVMPELSDWVNNGIMLLNFTTKVCVSEYSAEGVSNVRIRLEPSSLNANAWNNLIVSARTNTVTFYINNVSAATGSFRDSFKGWFGGKYVTSNGKCTCRMAGVRLYNRVLSAAERKKLFNEYRITD